jgi:Fic family protein
MTLVVRKVGGRDYYYSSLSYFLVNKSRSFSRYVGVKKPTLNELNDIESSFEDEIIERLSGKQYSAKSVKNGEVIRSLLFRDLFSNKYGKLAASMRRKYDIDSTVQFTLTTLTTEEVDVSLADVRNAFEKDSPFTQKEQISKNMLNAVESIKKPHLLDKKYLFELHRITMASFETKSPGQIRDRQVYLRRISGDNSGGSELGYRPPASEKVDLLLDKFVEWYGKSNLNPIEKATTSHYKLYKIHPFLDGNKRICRLVFNKTLLDEDFPLLNISAEKEKYFEALIASVENNQLRVLVEFAFKQYYKQVKEFLTVGRP